MVNKVCLRVLMYLLEDRLKECEQRFQINTFCTSGYDTPLLNVICLLNKLRYILCKYIVVIFHEATEKKKKGKTKQEYLHLLNFTISQIKRLKFYFLHKNKYLLEGFVCVCVCVSFFFLPVLYDYFETYASILNNFFFFFFFPVVYAFFAENVPI